MKNKKKYPVLMDSKISNLTVLFTDKTCGTVIYSHNCAFGIGFYYDKWDKKRFKPSKSIIRLLNDI